MRAGRHLTGKRSAVREFSRARARNETIRYSVIREFKVQSSKRYREREALADKVVYLKKATWRQRDTAISLRPGTSQERSSNRKPASSTMETMDSPLEHKKQIPLQEGTKTLQVKRLRADRRATGKHCEWQGLKKWILEREGQKAQTYCNNSRTLRSGLNHPDENCHICQ